LGGSSPRPTILSRVLLWLYRYLPLPLYGCLWMAYWLIPRGKGSLDARLALRSLPPRGRRAVWFHAASVGEISTIAPVVDQVRKMLPGVPVVVTTMTGGGARRAAAKLRQAEIALLPFDFYPAVRRFVSALEPSCLIIGETELWPNLVTETRRQGASVVLVNGRVSEKSYPRYRLVKFFMRGVLEQFDLLLMRTEVDATRIIGLGARPQTVEVAGNTKYDILPGPLGRDARRSIKEALGIGSGVKVVALGSAREGESEIVLRALAPRRGEETLRLVIAPRHLALVPQLEALCSQLGYASFTLSDLRLPEPERAGAPQVLILAQMGRLLETYAIADVAIVGGTLRPFGGHNPLEPASQGCATVVGPYIQNIRDDIEYLTSRGCAFAVNEGDLSEVIADILADEAKRAAIGTAAERAVAEKRGIAERCVTAMMERGLLPAV
jgi:3-deoxy-D-manno-octulosonic-acid transferase